MSADSNQRDLPLESDSGSRKPVISLYVFYLTLVIGVGATAVLFNSFSRIDDQHITERLQRGTATLIDAISVPEMQNNPMMDAIFDTIYRVRDDLPPGREIDQAYLDRYLWKSPPPGLETSALEYLPSVSLSERRELETRFGDKLPKGFEIREASGKDTVSAAIRDFYYPVLYESTRNAAKAVIGMDRGADPLVRLAMEQARDSGEFTTFSSFPLLGAGDQGMVSRYFLPVYRSGNDPGTVAERRKQLQGFVSIASYYPEEYTRFFPESYQGIEDAYFPRGNYQNQSNDPELQYALNRGTAVEFPYALKALNNAPWMAVTRAKPELIAAMERPTRWWVLSVGMLLTIWISSMLLWSRNQSARVLNLVKQRTGDLIQQTEKLHQVNSELRESESKYRMLADNASDVIYTFDLDGICNYISPSISRQTGYETTEFIGYSITRHLTEESAAAVMSRADKTKSLLRDHPENLKQSYIIECELECKDGSIMSIENTLSILTDEAGKPRGVIGVSRNITERKNNEREKKMLEDAYRQSQKLEAIGTLAGGVAHDFNNLLAGILGHTELLKRKLSGMDKAANSLEIIENTANRARELTSQLLGYARKGKYQLAPVDLNELISQVARLIERTVDKSITVKCNLSEQIPGIIGDAGQINQLILNLAVNARDALPKGGILRMETGVQQLDEQYCRYHQGLEAGTYSVVRVIDNGIGISPDKLERIFEPFFTDKQDNTGTGMGLAMVYGVAKNHGGIVLVDSKPGRGSTFTVYLPYSDTAVTEQPQPAGTDPVTGSGHILVVDDESMLRDLSHEMLSELGYKIMLAKDGQDAVDVYRRHRESIDLVIVDIIMPKMNGIDCLEKLREINPAVKVILMTGYSQEAMTENIEPDRIQGFLQKPFTIQELSELVLKSI